MRKWLFDSLHYLADRVGGIDMQAKRENNRRAFAALSRIGESAAKSIADAEKEAKRREKAGLLSMAPPAHWQHGYYLKQSYRLRPATDDGQGHWRGGPPRHQGAECPVCRKPLLLFLDLDCKDPRFAEAPDVFARLDRLPLYYCCRRPEETIYRIVAADRIETIKPELRTAEESPFTKFPAAFPREPLALEPVARNVELLLYALDYNHPDLLRPEEKQILKDYFGIKHVWSGFSPSRFGGSLNLGQRYEKLFCPNPDCRTHRMGHPLLRNASIYRMKEIAVIHSDAGFPMDMSCGRIVFHFCYDCHTVRGEYETS